MLSARNFGQADLRANPNCQGVERPEQGESDWRFGVRHRELGVMAVV